MMQSRMDLRSESVEETQEEHEPEEESIKEEGEPLEVRLARPKVVVPEYPVRKLHSSEISVRLSLLGKTADGDGYTYLKAKCTEMKLTDISAIRIFEHLQFVDVSDNRLTLDSLQVVTELPYLILIHADRNVLTSAALKKMKYMQVMIMNNNAISAVNDVFQPELSTLEVGYNKIEKIEFDHKMPTLKVLDFRYNMIMDISNIDFPNLDSLYLAGNKIKSLAGIERLVNLRVLHVRKNPIKNLNGFTSEQKKLQYINLRSCNVATRTQVKKLKVLEALETLILRGCPYMGGPEEEAGTDIEDDVETRLEVLATLPKLKRLNKTPVTPEERNEANEILRQWIEEGEPDDNVEAEGNDEDHDLVDEQDEEHADSNENK